MKKNLCLIFAVVLILTTLVGCQKEADIIGTWVTKGTVVGLEEKSGSYDIHVTFNDNNIGDIMEIYKDGTINNYNFEFSVFDGYITFISYNGEVYDKGNHTYPYSIEDDVLTINVNNRKIELNKLNAEPTNNN